MGALMVMTAPHGSGGDEDGIGKTAARMMAMHASIFLQTHRDMQGGLRHAAKHAIV